MASHSTLLGFIAGIAFGLILVGYTKWRKAQ
jgi:hypothetical protein